VIPPQLVDIAVVDDNAIPKTVAPVNILRTPWEAPDSAVSPMTTAGKRTSIKCGDNCMLTEAELPNAARLPTPPSDAPPAPQRTFQNVNHVANALIRQVAADDKYEKERLRKRQKRQQGTAATPTEAPILSLPPPDKMTKKDKDALKKQNQTDDVLHRKANETASMALGFGKKKKYSWMTGGAGGGGGPGAAAPKPAAAASGSGTATPAAPTVDSALKGARRKFGAPIENTEIGAKIQIRDLIHVLEHDGREKKTLTLMLARLKNTDKDEWKADFERRLPAAAGR
jgi:hypothetical protein